MSDPTWARFAALYVLQIEETLRPLKSALATEDFTEADEAAAALGDLADELCNVMVDEQERRDAATS
jgi:hypothetical protein